MLGKRDRRQPELFVAGSLRELLPDDHVLVLVERVLDLSWLRAEVTELYDAENGRPSIDPEAALRLMLAGFLLGIVHDRRLLREAQVNLAIRWFAGYGLHERLPDHSSLTRIRQRWGPDRFRQIFQRTVTACLEAKLAVGDVVHVDATLIRADVSWDSLVEKHLDEVFVAAAASGEDVSFYGRLSGEPKKSSVTDRDASLAKTSPGERLFPAYKQHVAVDDASGIILDVDATTGDFHESGKIVLQLDAVEELTGRPICAVTADGAYGLGKVYDGCEQREIEAIIPPRPVTSRRKALFGPERFKHDARHDIVRCPRGKKLARRSRHGDGWEYRAKPSDCNKCPLRSCCVGEAKGARRVFITDLHAVVLRARRRRTRWGAREHTLYARHRWRVEGVHGTAKTWHGLRRAVRRGLGNVRIQAFLTAMAINLKRLAAAILIRLLELLRVALGMETVRIVAALR
jgi:transposase